MLRIQPSSEAVSIAVGFKAPAFSLKGLTKVSHGSGTAERQDRLTPVLVGHLSFCKSILPEFNSLVKKLADKDFIALDVAREESAGGN